MFLMDQHGLKNKTIRFNYIFLVCVWVLSFSCKHEIRQTYLDKELEAINDIISSIVDIDYYYAPYLPIELVAKDSFPESVVNKNEIEYSKNFENYKEILKTMKLFLYLDDTLSGFNFNLLEDSLKLIVQQESFIQNLDSVVHPIKFPLSDISKDCGLNILAIPPIRDYKIYDNLGFADDTLKIGIMSVGRILFDEKFEKGIFLFSLASSGTSGRVQWVIIEYDKLSNKWKIKDKIVIEVS